MRRRTIVLVLGFLILAGAGYLIYPFVSGKSGSELPVASATDTEPLPTLVVEASYPGAAAQVVAGKVAVPIEQQMNGVDGMLHMRSQSDNSGSYTLTLTFERGTNLDAAQVLVQKRLDLARPGLPDGIKQSVISIRKEAPGAVLIATLSAPEGRYDRSYLSNYTNIQLKDELARLAGVARIRLVGQRDEAFRVCFDPEALVKRALTAADVKRALEEQKVQVQVDELNKEVLLVGGHVGPQQIKDLIVKRGPDAGVVRLKDVARVDPRATGYEGFAALAGRPVVALVLSQIPAARPGDISATVQKRLTQLRAKLPEGLALDLVFDSTPGPGATEYLGSDVDLPDSSSTERTQQVVDPYEALIRAVDGVRDVLALSESPFDRSRNQSHRAFLLVRLNPAGNGRPSREAIMKSIRGLFAQFPGATLRLRDLAAPGALPGGGYAIRLAIHTAADLRMDNLQSTADALVRQLNKKPELTDAFTGFRANTPLLSLEIDRKEAARRGVAVDQISKAIQSELGQSMPVNDREKVERLGLVKVRDAKGKMVPLGTMVSLTDGSGPLVIERLNLELMAEITANLAPGVSLAEARAVCEEQARTTLPKEYRLTWLSEMPPVQKAK